jgi:hypothetical protein
MAIALELTEAEYEKLPEAKKGDYILNGDGKYHLDLDRDAVELRYAKPLKSAHDRVKTERQTLAAELESMRGRLEGLGLDDEEIAEAIETHRKAKEKKLIDAGDVDTLINTRVEAELKKERKTTSAEKATLAEKATKLATRLNKELVENPVLAGCVKHGVKPTAKDDVVSRALRVWRVDEEGAHGEAGEVVPIGPDGLVLTDGEGNRLTFDGWFAQLQVDADHLFVSNAGSGASNPGGSGGAGSRAGLRRSQLSNDQKNKMIDDMGYDDYMKIPW